MESVYKDTDFFKFSFTPIKGFFNVLKRFSTDADLSALTRSHELYSQKIMKVVEKVKLEPSPVFELDEMLFLRIESFIINKTNEFFRIQTQRNSMT